MTTRSERFEMNPPSERVRSGRGLVRPQPALRRKRGRAGWGWTAVLLIVAGLISGAPASCAADAKYAIAMHGEPALPPDFAAFPYVDPDAPKGGQFTQGI